MNGTFRQTLLRLPGLFRLAGALLLIPLVGAFALIQSRESVAQAGPVDLGTARSFSVLAGARVTNTGPSIIGADLGVSPGTAITGFPPGIVLGAQHSADAVALQAKSDLTLAYNDAAGRTPATSVAGDLVGQTLPHGIYASTSTLGLTGTLTLDGEGDPNAVFIFQIASTLITGSGSDINLINGAQACNVFWQVGSSATLGTNSTFVGNILALIRQS
ncbi:ice-binding family protein [Nonomuraea cavernae]|uniref:ice-binding family protein n=1 Tax=Nonomuraea cavernae TaxID=2045107 RepID=UPI0033E63CAC